MSLPCPRCGRRTRPDARFCDGCGVALPGADAASVAPGNDDAPDNGREGELAIVAQRLRTALTGNGAVVALCGEPGIGKSHTAQEAARRAAALGLHVLWGRCNEELGAPPYWPWRQLLQAWMEAHDADALRRAAGRDAGLLADLLPELAQRIPGVRPPPVAADSLQGRFRLFEAIAGFWKRAAHEQPLLLVL
jgi:predicted ATPase